MTDVIDDLRSLGSGIGPAADEDRERMRRLLLAEASNAQSSRRWRWFPSGRRGLAAVAALVAIPATVAVAASLHDLGDNFDGFLTGDTSGREIGRPVGPSDNPPKWFNGEGYRDQLVIATNGSHHLFMARDPKGHVSFAFDDSAGLTSASGVDPFVEKFAGKSVVPLFAAGEAEGLLYSGLVAPDVDRLELTFTSGDPETVDVDGAGFIADVDLGGDGAQDRGVLLVDRRPVELRALDADGNILQSIPAMCVFGMPAMSIAPDRGDFGAYFDACEKYYEEGGL